MVTEILEFVEGAERAKGFVVIIDVFRAFSVACYASDAGVDRIIATGEPEEAFRLKQKYRNSVLAGEREERMIPGFDLGNSPTEVLQHDLAGKLLIHTTTAGTRGLLSASKAEVLVTGSLVNAAAVAKFILSADPAHVSLVAMGYRGKISAREDIVCAEYIRSLITGNGRNFADEISDLRNSAGSRFFVRENLAFSPPSDFFLCTMTDRFNFILKAVRRDDGNIELERVDIK